MLDINKTDWFTPPADANDWYAQNRAKTLGIDKFRKLIKAFTHQDVGRERRSVKVGRYFISTAGKHDLKIFCREYGNGNAQDYHAFAINYSYLENFKIDTDNGVIVINNKVGFKYK